MLGCAWECPSEMIRARLVPSVGDPTKQRLRHWYFVRGARPVGPVDRQRGPATVARGLPVRRPSGIQARHDRKVPGALLPLQAAPASHVKSTSRGETTGIPTLRKKGGCSRMPPERPRASRPRDWPFVAERRTPTRDDGARLGHRDVEEFHRRDWRTRCYADNPMRFITKTLC